MCKLCERDAELGEGWPVCQDDRLAVLERDHEFVEHIRKHLAELGLKDVMCKICNKTQDAILKIKGE